MGSIGGEGVGGSEGESLGLEQSKMERHVRLHTGGSRTVNFHGTGHACGQHGNMWAVLWCLQGIWDSR